MEQEALKRKERLKALREKAQAPKEDPNSDKEDEEKPETIPA